MSDSTPPPPLPASGEGKGEKPVRIVSVGLDESVHLLPLSDALAHDLSPGCWCEPERCLYIPDDPEPGERFPAWNHKAVS